MITLCNYLMIGIKYLAKSAPPAALFAIVIFLLWKKFGSPSHEQMRPRLYAGLFVRIWYVIFLLLIVFGGRLDTFDGVANFSAFAAYREAIIDFSAESVLNILFNIVLFVPFGFLFASTFSKRKLSWIVLPLGLLSTITIEAVQFTLSVGIMDVDDIINNFLGVIIGFCLYKAFSMFTCSGKPAVSIRAILYTIPALLPFAIFGGVYAEYLLQDYGNIRLESYYGLRLSERGLAFDESVLSSLSGETAVYKIKGGTAEDAFDLADYLFGKLGTVFGRVVDYYDDCCVLASDGNKLTLWYYYDTATYRLNDYFRGDSDETVTAEQATAAFESIGIEIPADADFKLTEEGKGEFTVKPDVGEKETQYGSITFVYSGGQVHNIEHGVMSLTPAESLEAPSAEELLGRIRCGDFYANSEARRALEGGAAINVSDVDTRYTVDTKNFCRPLYQVTVDVDGERAVLYVLA